MRALPMHLGDHFKLIDFRAVLVWARPWRGGVSGAIVAPSVFIKLMNLDCNHVVDSGSHDHLD